MGPETVKVTFESSPSGATVWIDGKDVGQTPLTRRVKGTTPVRVTLIRAGHRMLKTTLDPATTPKLEERLEPIPPALRGETGVRVDCSTAGKYPVFADDQETGLLCPTGRITLPPGVHKVGLYMPDTDEIISKDVLVEDGIRSVKLRK